MFFKILIFFLFIESSIAKDKIKIDNNVFLEKVKFSDLVGWENENYKEALDVFLSSCRKIKTIPKNIDIFPQVKRKINSEDFYAVCKIADVIKNYNDRYLKVFFENYFAPYRVVDKSGNKSLFTGYYLPQINAKKTKDKIYKYPIYGRPKDLARNARFYTRKEINNGALADQNLELLYTDDLVELFFFHIQGSGNVFLVDENRVISIGYDGKNNQKFTSIGKYMLKYKLIEPSKINAKDIKKELKKDPKLAEFIMNKNDSYIFFKIIENGNITGAFGSELVPFRTLAVDRKYIPLGFPLWLSTTHNTKDYNEKFNRLVIANDTGSAIKGAIRGDIFFGSGINGENNASFQHAEGEYFLLLPERILRKISK